MQYEHLKESASLIYFEQRMSNTRIPHYNGDGALDGAGLIMRPSATRIFCGFGGDAGGKARNRHHVLRGIDRLFLGCNLWNFRQLNPTFRLSSCGDAGLALLEGVGYAGQALEGVGVAPGCDIGV